MKRQRDHESGLVLSAVDRDRTPVRLHDRPRDVEPESQSPAFRARAKGLEDATALFGRNGAAIRHLCPDVRSVATSEHRDGSVGRAVLDRIAEQVLKDLGQASAIPVPVATVLAFDSNLPARLRQLDLRDHVGSDLAQLAALGLDGDRAMLAPREIEQIADQPAHLLGARSDPGRRLLGHFWNVVPSRKEVGGQRNRLQRVSQVVPKRADEELALLFTALALGNIDECGHGRDDGPALVPNGPGGHGVDTSRGRPHLLLRHHFAAQRTRKRMILGVIGRSILRPDGQPASEVADGLGLRP